MLYRTSGIVIRSMDYGESDKIITVITNTHGKVGIMVRGAKKMKSRFASLAQLFTHAEFVFFRKSGLGTLNYGEIMTSHHRLREQLELTAYASYAAELLDRAFEEQEAGSYLFEQISACFNALEQGKDPSVTLQLFEMKVLAAAGYGPQLEACVSCSREQGPHRFSARLGGLLCTSCYSKDPAAAALGEGAMKLLRLYRQMDLRRLGEIKVSDGTKAELKRVMRALMDHHLGITLKSRAFLDQIDRMI